MSPIEEFILECIQTRYSLPSDTDINTLNYVDTGYVDSMEILRFIVMLEDRFCIEFSDDDLRDPAFKVVGKLRKLIEQKLESKYEGSKIYIPA